MSWLPPLRLAPMGLAPIALAALIAAACGDEAPPLSPPTHPDRIGTEHTLEDVCDHLAVSLCAAREPCCRSLDLAFDGVRCEERERTRCQATIDVIEAGLVTFDGNAVDACIEEFVRVIDRCTLPASEAVYEAFDLATLCGRAFRGTKAVGEACELDSECANDVDTIAGCDDEAFVCVASRVHREGDTCDLTGNFCAPGLHCAFDLTQMPYEGTCEAVAPLGTSCDAQAPVSPCGPGRHCDAATSTCERSKSPGQPCERDVECLSLTCETEGTCGPLAPVVGAEECTG